MHRMKFRRRCRIQRISVASTKMETILGCLDSTFILRVFPTTAALESLTVSFIRLVSHAGSYIQSMAFPSFREIHRFSFVYFITSDHRRYTPALALDQRETKCSFFIQVFSQCSLPSTSVIRKTPYCRLCWIYFCRNAGYRLNYSVMVVQVKVRVYCWANYFL